MRKIPQKLRDTLAKDPWMTVCIHISRPPNKRTTCKGRITWEHAFLYTGKQINEAWAIVPVCWYHHLGKGLDKKHNQKVALSRATEKDLKKYPKKNWWEILKRFQKKRSYN